MADRGQGNKYSGTGLLELPAPPVPPISLYGGGAGSSTAAADATTAASGFTRGVGNRYTASGLFDLPVAPIPPVPLAGQANGSAGASGALSIASTTGSRGLGNRYYGRGLFDEQPAALSSRATGGFYFPAGTSAASGGLTLAAALSASSPGAGTAAGDLVMDVGLAGEAAGSSTATGTPDVGPWQSLGGVAAGQSGAAGDLVTFPVTLLDGGVAAGAATATAGVLGRGDYVDKYSALFVGKAASTPYTHTWSTVGKPPSGPLNGASNWYRYVPLTDGYLTADQAGSTAYYPYLFLMAANGTTVLTQNYGYGALSYFVTAGTTYYLVSTTYYGYYSDFYRGPLTLNIAASSPATITVTALPGGALDGGFDVHGVGPDAINLVLLPDGAVLAEHQLVGDLSNTLAMATDPVLDEYQVTAALRRDDTFPASSVVVEYQVVGSLAVVSDLPGGSAELDVVVGSRVITFLAGEVAYDVEVSATLSAPVLPLAGQTEWDVTVRASAPSTVLVTPADGEVELAVEVEGLLDYAPPRPGDTIATAVVLTGDHGSSDPIDFNQMVRQEPDEQYYYSLEYRRTAWFLWTAPVSGLVNFRYGTGWLRRLEDMEYGIAPHSAAGDFLSWRGHRSHGYNVYQVTAGVEYLIGVVNEAVDGVFDSELVFAWSMPKRYAYDPIDGSCPDGLPWPPPPSIADLGLSGSQPSAIGWRRDADLAIVFAVTDTWNAIPFTPGYQIPRRLKTRAGPFCKAGTIPMNRVFDGTYDINDRVGLSNEYVYFPERWGYLDDYFSIPAPKGALTLSDWEYATQAGTILTVGVDFSGGYAENQLRALSAMSGASLNNYLLGNVIPSESTGNARTLATAVVDVIQLYARATRAKSVDVVWAVDNTGSMGSRRQLMKNAAAYATGDLLAAGINTNFAFTTFSDWNIVDQPKSVAESSGHSTSYTDDAYRIRFPFGPLTVERQSAFNAASYPGQGGDDGPETLLEALCRIYTGRANRPVVGVLRNSALAGPARLTSGSWQVTAQ